MIFNKKIKLVLYSYNILFVEICNSDNWDKKQQKDKNS